MEPPPGARTHSIGTGISSPSVCPSGIPGPWTGTLLAPVLDRADREGLACFLETSDPANVGFYHRFGFDVVDDALALVPGGPTHVAMRRVAPQR